MTREEIEKRVDALYDEISMNEEEIYFAESEILKLEKLLEQFV